MTTIPCDECNGTGFVASQVCCGRRRVEDGECCGDPDIDYDPCPRPRCVGGQIELTDDEVKAMEAEQANVRG